MPVTCFALMACVFEGEKRPSASLGGLKLGSNDSTAGMGMGFTSLPSAGGVSFRLGRNLEVK